MPNLPPDTRYDPTYPLFPVLSCLSIAVVLVPAYWQFRAHNIGTSLYITWTIIGNVIYLVDSVLWYGNLEEHSGIWCDISTKLIVGLSVALPAASLIINRRLYKIATIQQVHVSTAESRLNVCIELSLGVGLPIMVMTLHVISQGHRYDVIENFGCWPTTYMTPVTLFTIFTWPIIISLVSAVYASLSIRAFFRQRKAFVEALQSANSDLNVNRYFRLMALAGTELAFSLPFSTYLTVTNCLNGLFPWVSWKVTHYQFNRITYVPFGIVAVFPHTWALFDITRYALPAGGFFCFIYLGLSGEAGQFWKRCIDYLRRCCGSESQADTTLQPQWAAGSRAKPSHEAVHPRYFPSSTSLPLSSWGGKQASLSVGRQPNLSSETIPFPAHQHLLVKTGDGEPRIPDGFPCHHVEPALDFV